MDLNGPTVRPSRLLVSPLDDDHPAFKHFHYVLAWKGNGRYIVMDKTETRAFDECGEPEWWAEVRDLPEAETFYMTLAQAIRVAEGIFDKLRINGYTVQDALTMDPEGW